MTTYSQTSWTIENRKGGKAVWVFFYAVKSLLRWIAQTRFLVSLFCRGILLARVSAVHHLIAVSRFGGRGPRSIGFC